MKKTLIFLVIIAVCTQLCSCSDKYLPLTSDNFSKDFLNSFSDNYHLVDPQLAYVTASPWEVEKKVDSDKKLFLSLINNVDRAQFISVTEKQYYYMGGGPDYSLFVYQTSDAPTPMKDWTIKNIRVLKVNDWAFNEDEIISLSEKYLETILDYSDVLHIYNNDNDPDFIDMIKNAYLTAEHVSKYTIGPINDRTDYSQLGSEYSLLIEFNECDNIVWHSYLCEYNGDIEDSDNIYFECTTYADDEREGCAMAKIDDEYISEIRSLIDE